MLPMKKYQQYDNNGFNDKKIRKQTSLAERDTMILFVIIQAMKCCWPNIQIKPNIGYTCRY